MTRRRIAFLLERNVYLKFYLPVIDALLADGCEVDVWYQKSDAYDAQKSYQLVRVEELPERIRRRCGLFSYRDGKEVVALASDRRPASIVSLQPKYQVLPEAHSELTCPFICLQHGPIDTFLPVARELQDYADEICLFSQQWLKVGAAVYRDAGQEYLDAYEKHFIPRASVLGWPALDPLSSIDPTQVRRKFGLSEDRRMVLIVPLELASNSSFTRATSTTMEAFAATTRAQRLRTTIRQGTVGAWNGWLKGYDERHLLHGIRGFCDRNNAALFGKGRRKDPFRPIFEQTCDQLFYDTQDYDPPLLLELLSVADLVIHFGSGVTLEAAAAGVPSVYIKSFDLTDADLRDIGGRGLYDDRIGSVFNFPGVNEPLSLADSFAKFRSARLEDFKVDAAKRRDYLAKWVGAVDGKRAHRVADSILSRCASPADA